MSAPSFRSCFACSNELASTLSAEEGTASPGSRPVADDHWAMERPGTLVSSVPQAKKGVKRSNKVGVFPVLVSYVLSSWASFL